MEAVRSDDGQRVTDPDDLDRITPLIDDSFTADERVREVVDLLKNLLGSGHSTGRSGDPFHGIQYIRVELDRLLAQGSVT
ncbi:MAG: hypothetical protein ACO1NQ_02340 [Flavobacteriales bacterium]